MSLNWCFLQVIVYFSTVNSSPELRNQHVSDLGNNQFSYSFTCTSEVNNGDFLFCRSGYYTKNGLHDIRTINQKQHPGNDSQNMDLSCQVTVTEPDVGTALYCSKENEFGHWIVNSKKMILIVLSSTPSPSPNIPKLNPTETIIISNEISIDPTTRTPDISRDATTATQGISSLDTTTTSPYGPEEPESAILPTAIILAAGLGAAAVLLLVAVVALVRCRRKRYTDPNEIDTHDDVYATAQVTYAILDLQSSTTDYVPVRGREKTPYAQIIGVYNKDKTPR